MAVEHHRGQAAGDQEQAQEQQDPQHGRGVVEQGVEVELHPAHHEEDGDEEAEADGRQLGADGLEVVALDEEAHDDAGGEGPEEDVEAEVARHPDQRHHHEHGDAHRELGARVQVPAHQVEHAG